MDFIGAKDDGGGGDSWTELIDVQSGSQMITTNKPTPAIYSLDALHVTQPLNQQCQSTATTYSYLQR